MNFNILNFRESKKKNKHNKKTDSGATYSTDSNKFIYYDKEDTEPELGHFVLNRTKQLPDACTIYIRWT